MTSNMNNNVRLCNGVTYQAVTYISLSDVWLNHPRSRYAYRCSDEDGCNQFFAPSLRAAKELGPDKIVKINRQGMPVCWWIRGVDSRGQYYRQA